jgi:hypothetical protein
MFLYFLFGCGSIFALFLFQLVDEIKSGLHGLEEQIGTDEHHRETPDTTSPRSWARIRP